MSREQNDCPYRQRPRRAAFSQSDVTRTLKAHMQAGLCVARSVIRPTGEIEIVTAYAEEAGETMNTWD